MTGDDDLIRSMLLGYEKQEDWLILAPETLSMDAESRRRLGHIKFMCDAGILAKVGTATYRITNQGRDYIASIKNAGIWQKTKDGAAAVGEVTLAVMKDIAVAYVKRAAREKLGLQL